MSERKSMYSFLTGVPVQVLLLLESFNLQRQFVHLQGHFHVRGVWETLHEFTAFYHLLTAIVDFLKEIKGWILREVLSKLLKVEDSFRMPHWWQQNWSIRTLCRTDGRNPRYEGINQRNIRHWFQTNIAGEEQCCRRHPGALFRDNWGMVLVARQKHSTLW